jgi:uncharacterized protein YdhG (YjbR/CyaY superfamily)
MKRDIPRRLYERKWSISILKDRFAMKRHLAVKKNNPANSNGVDGYLAPLPDDVRKMLEKIRAAIRSAAPKAQEVISYQIPAYKYNGPVVFFAAFKNHCGLYVINPGILELFKDELNGFKTAGTTIHFSVGNPIPLTLVKRIVKARIRENLENK